MWDTRPGGQLAQWLNHADAVRHAEFSGDGARVLTASLRSGARLWDARTGDPLTPWLVDSNWMFGARFNPSGTRVLTISGRGVALWDAQTGQLLVPLLETLKGVDGADFSPDGMQLVVAGQRNTGVWDLTTGQAVGPPMPRADIVRFSPEGGKILLVDFAKARVWQVADGQPLSEPTGRHSTRVNDAAFSPDGRLLVTASDDHTAKLRDARTGQALGAKTLRHDGAVIKARFSRDSRHVLTVSKDDSVRVWDAQTGEPACEPLRHPAPLRWGEFSPDGQWVLTACEDGKARVWDVRSSQPIIEPLAHEFALSHAAFSPDQRWIVTASHDKTARIWEVPSPTLPVPSWLPELAEAVVAQRRDEKGAFRPVFPREFVKLKDRVGTFTGSNTWVQWAKWFFADRDSRTISPSSPLRLNDYVQRRHKENHEHTLREAVRVAPTNAFALVWLAQRLLDKSEGTNGRDFMEAERLSLDAYRLAPAASEVALTRVQVLEQSSRIDEAMRILERALAQHPQSPDLGHANGRLLLGTRRFEEAERACSRAIELAALQASSGRKLPRMLLDRASVRRALGRLADAAADIRAARPIPARDAGLPPALIDLSPFYNAGLTQNWHGAEPGNNLAGLPQGRQTLGGVEFDLRGLIQLAGRRIRGHDGAFPERLEGIVVEQECGRLHFLHSTLGKVADGTRIGSYLAHYADGQRHEIPIVYGVHLREWHAQSDTTREVSNATEAWAGSSPIFNPLRQFRTTWTNPRPDARVERLDFISAMTNCSPFLIAITAEKAPP